MRLERRSTADINKVIHKNTELSVNPIEINDLRPSLPKHLSKPPQLTA
jgi:hypothetical protein